MGLPVAVVFAAAAAGHAPQCLRHSLGEAGVQAFMLIMSNGR